MTDWQKQRSERNLRLEAGSRYATGKMVTPENAKALLEAVIRPGDRVCLEGDNQKQADFLAEVLAIVDQSRIHDLHIVQSGLVLQAHLDLFERGIARKLDFSYSGPQGAAIARALTAGKIELGAIHTYIELFARYFMDLTPHVALIVARQADRDGNLYTGPNTEDTPTIVEATAFKSGIVVAQVNEIVDKVPRVDIPGDQVDFIIKADRPFYVEPLFTRDPASVTESQVLMAMMAILLMVMTGVDRPVHHLSSELKKFWNGTGTDLYRWNRLDCKVRVQRAPLVLRTSLMFLSVVGQFLMPAIFARSIISSPFLTCMPR